MVHKKQEPGSFFKELLEDIEARKGKLIKKRWHVVEITPSVRYRQGDGHGGIEWSWTREKSIRVSDYFNYKNMADLFISEHDPEEGNYLQVRCEGLYEKTIQQWHHETSV
jgi:hypothetical protein